MVMKGWCKSLSDLEQSLEVSIQEKHPKVALAKYAAILFGMQVQLLAALSWNLGIRAVNGCVQRVQ